MTEFASTFFAAIGAALIAGGVLALILAGLVGLVHFALQALNTGIK